MQPQNLLLIYKNLKKMRLQLQKMLLTCIFFFLQYSQISTKENEVPTSKNAPNLDVTLSTVFPQLHHVCGWLPYIILKKIQPQNLLLIYSF